MVEPFMESKHFECPDCGKPGAIAQLKGRDGFHLVDDSFRLEMRDGEQEIVCSSCGTLTFPRKSN
jgi:predicted RNA-binding Zn-ribbon protein involved in translation (DUF1610 family)